MPSHQDDPEAQTGPTRHKDGPEAESLASLIDQIDALLPQTQCQRCGYPACRPYAEAIAEGRAPINRCPPGGQLGIAKLSAITGMPEIPLDTDCGEEGPFQTAVIDPQRCIGCTLCIAACPVDAIIGGFKHLHQVIAEDCTGCALCLPPCPVDCIDMVVPTPAVVWDAARASAARGRVVSPQEPRPPQAGQEREDKPEIAQKQREILAAARARAARKKTASARAPLS
ncbi:MAG: RnfABCDGE type electron transport complex subunit B [Burkholderiaceae bacterium]